MHHVWWGPVIPILSNLMCFKLPLKSHQCVAPILQTVLKTNINRTFFLCFILIFSPPKSTPSFANTHQHIGGNSWRKKTGQEGNGNTNLLKFLRNSLSKVSRTHILHTHRPNNVGFGVALHV